MMIKEELVSVIIPTYKRPIKLKRAITSVLNQTYKNIEVIIVDDNNEGDEFRKETIVLMENFRNNKKVVYLKHKTNKNGSAARNTGINYTKAKYIAFLDDDDLFEPDKIKKQVNYLLKNPKKDAVVCLAKKSFRGCTYKKNIITGDFHFLSRLLSGEIDFGAGSTLLIKKQVLLNLQGFDESFKRHQDWELLVRFFREYELGVLQEYLTEITVDGHRNYPNAEGFEKTKRKFIKTFENDMMSLEKKEYNEIYQNHFKEMILYYFIEGNKEKVKQLLKELEEYKGTINLAFKIKCNWLFLEKRINILYPLKYYLLSIVNYVV